MKGIEQCQHLRSLDLRNNQIKKIEGLAGLRYLSINDLFLDGNPIEEITRADLLFLRSIGMGNESPFEVMIREGKIRIVE